MYVKGDGPGHLLPMLVSQEHIQIFHLRGWSSTLSLLRSFVFHNSFWTFGFFPVLLDFMCPTPASMSSLTQFTFLAPCWVHAIHWAFSFRNSPMSLHAFRTPFSCFYRFILFLPSLGRPGTDSTIVRWNWTRSGRFLVSWVILSWFKFSPRFSGPFLVISLTGSIHTGVCVWGIQRRMWLIWDYYLSLISIKRGTGSEFCGVQTDPGWQGSPF